jgi:hydroxymethylpyrimidine pyrophosphatase-like HAD family hydrolase
MERVKLLVSDLDGTLVGDADALSRFMDWYRRTDSNIQLVYSSGLFLHSIRGSIKRLNLPQPVAIVGGVGTGIYDYKVGQKISGWPPNLFGWSSQIVRSVCSSYRELEVQPEEYISPYKISYYGVGLDDDFLAGMTRQLANAGVQVSIVYGSARE